MGLGDLSDEALAHAQASIASEQRFAMEKSAARKAAAAVQEDAEPSDEHDQEGHVSARIGQVFNDRRVLT